MNKRFFDTYTVNIIVLSLLSFLEALQVLIILALVFSFIPYTIPPFVQKLFPLSQYDVHMERESFFYHVWIGSALLLQGVLLFWYRRRLGEGHLWRSFGAYICTMAGIIVIQIFAVFKIFLWSNPWWARDLFYFALGLGGLVRIFWPEFRRLILKVWTQLTTRRIPWWGQLLMDAAVVGILLFLVFTPDLSKVLSRMFSYDKFYHLDSFIMSPGWAYHNGLVLNRDVTSEYSLIIPIVFDGLMKLTGGFSYAHAVGWMIALCAMYYFLLYGVWRYWTGSLGLAVFALLASVKLQFFHWGVEPLIWIYPSATPIRFLPDVFFLFFILRFTQSLNLRWLFAAAVASALALAWTMDVGIYMYVVLLLAAAAGLYLKGAHVFSKALAAAVLPLGLALGFFSIFYQSLVGQGSFWHNTFEFAKLFLQGWGALPITDGLKDKQFFAFGMGWMIPVAYLGTLLYCLSVFLCRRLQPHLFMALVSAYGLGLYHYFIHRSAVTSYYVVVVPLIFVLLFWIQAGLERLSAHWQKGIKILLCVWALTALVTGYWFTYYPNVLNLSGYDWRGEQKFYATQFDFSRDAALIDALTDPQERVALISSFETRILMQANRRPFFYYFPMMESEHMQGDKLRGIYLHTYDRLARTLGQLQDQAPSYIFIQTILFEGATAKTYERNSEGFKQLMAYIRQHYQFQARGQYLTALGIIKSLRNEDEFK